MFCTVQNCACKLKTISNNFRLYLSKSLRYGAAAHKPTFHSTNLLSFSMVNEGAVLTCSHWMYIGWPKQWKNTPKTARVKYVSVGKHHHTTAVADYGRYQGTNWPRLHTMPLAACRLVLPPCLGQSFPLVFFFNDFLLQHTPSYIHVHRSTVWICVWMQGK